MSGDINYFKVFDVTQGEAAGLEAESANSVSDYAPDHGGPERSREAESADVTINGKEAAGEEPAENRAGAGKYNKRVQSDEENAQFAARRREWEAASVRAERGKPNGRWNARENVPDPPESAASEAAEIPEPGERTNANEPREGGEMSYEEQLRLFRRNPQILQELRQAETSARAERDFAVDRSIRQRIESEVSEIGRLDPSVRCFEDLRNSPDYGRLGQLVRGGISLVDAYKLTHFDRLQENAAVGARQAALNAREGKSHLQHLGGTGGDSPSSVPGEVQRAYRAIMPDLSMREIERHYNEYLTGNT